MSVPMVEPAASAWQELTAEILWKLMDVLQRQDPTVSAFFPQRSLSSFKRVCSQWRQAALRGLFLVQLPCAIHECVATLIDHAGVGQRHPNLLKSCSDGVIRVLLDNYTGAQSLTLPVKGTLTERTISTLQEFPCIRFLDVTRDRSALNIDELVQLEGVTTMMAWFHNNQEQLGKWRLCTICENLTALKHISIAERHVHAMPAGWEEKLNCLTQLKLLVSLASRRLPSPACLAALTNLTRLELSCLDDRDNYYLNPAMDIVPSLPCLKALQLGRCPTKQHLQSLSRMPHLTSFVVGLKSDIGSTPEIRGVCSLHDVHELCCMAIVGNLDCTECRVHVWSQGQAETKVHFCIPGTKYKLTMV